MAGPDVGEGAPWWLAGGMVAFWLAREAWGALLSRRKERSETDANVVLIEGLTGRVKALEERLTNQDARLQQEMELRLKAQEHASALRTRIRLLESTLRQLGAVIPDPEGVSA